MVKRVLALALSALLTLVSVGAAQSVQITAGARQIVIINDRPEYWQIRVWVYEGGALSERNSMLCQVLDWSTETVRVVGPAAGSAWGGHCDGFDSLTFWFEVQSPRFRQWVEFTTFGSPTPWGATWRWNGVRWTCEGC